MQGDPPGQAVVDVTHAVADGGGGIGGVVGAPQRDRTGHHFDIHTPTAGRAVVNHQARHLLDQTVEEGVQTGDEVTLIGKDGEQELTMEYLGDLSGRFNYELACDLSKRIPRVYLKAGEVVATKDYHEEDR